MEIVDKLRDAVSRRGIPKAEILRRAGLGPNVLNALECDDFNPRLKTLIALGKAADELIAERS